MQYLNAEGEQEKGERANELEQFIQMKPLDDPNGVPLSSLHQHGTDEEPAYSSLVVAPSPSYLASILQAQMANAMRVAERQGDAQTQELIERKMSEIRRATPHEDGGEAEFNQAENDSAMKCKR